jgi:hypothetical protein
MDQIPLKDQGIRVYEIRPLDREVLGDYTGHGAGQRGFDPVLRLSCSNHCSVSDTSGTSGEFTISSRTPWNCSEVYVRIDGKWRIVHNH